MSKIDENSAAEGRPGILIAVVGPSGAGKDSLLSYARDVFGTDQKVQFVRRVITRDALASTEDHDTLTPEAFAQAKAAGDFAVTWDAHGLSYAIPASVHDHLASGGVAILNGSRAALPSIRNAFGSVLTVNITCHPDVLAARLAGRGREDAAGQQQRLARAVMPVEADADLIEIDNSGELAVAGDALVAVIQERL